MNVERNPIRGSLKTVGDEPQCAILIPLLPTDGGYSIHGTILAVDDADRRSSVVVYAYFSGTVVAGTAKENDVAAPEMEPEEGGLAEGCAVETSVTGKQVHIVLKGPKGKTVNWAWALDVVALTLPSAPITAPTATPAACPVNGGT